jgi:hypothetical protein
VRPSQRIVTWELDPQADLISAQRLAVELEVMRRGVDPEHPWHLDRSVVLAGASGPSIGRK